MKLNKLQRHTAYIILFVEATKKVGKKNYHDGFCHLFKDVTGEWPSCYYGELKKWLPELDIKGPSNGNPYKFWFPETKKGWQKRIEILKQCIKETAQYDTL